MIEVEAPDGTIVEFPEGTSNAIMEKALQEKYGAPKKVSKFQSFATGAADAASFGFGDEAAAKLDEIRGIGNYDSRLSYHRENLAQTQKQNPLSALAGSLVGSVGTGVGVGTGARMALPQLARAAGGIAAARPVATSAAVGAGGANLYGLGSATQANPYGIRDAAINTGLGGGLGALGGYISKLVPSYARPTGGRSAGMATGTGNAPVAPSALSSLGTNQLTPATGTILPMVKGVAEGDKDIMRSVQMAKRGLMGVPLEDAVTSIEQAQQGKIRSILGEFGADAVDPYAGASDVGGLLQKAYTSTKAKTGAAYKALREAGTDVRYSPESTQLLNENLIKAVNPFKVGIEAGTLPNASAIYKTLASRVGKSDLSPAELIDLRTQINGLVSKGAVTPDDAALLSIKGGVDNFLDNAIGDALVNGDDKVIQLYKKANEARKIQGRLFEDNQAIFDLVRNRDLQPENVANVIFGAGLGKKGKSAAGTTGQIARDIIAATGENSAEARELLRKGVMSRVLSRSISGETVSPAKLATNLEEVFKNQPTLRDQLFDASEIESVAKLTSELNQLVRAEARDIASTSGSGEVAPRVLMKFLKLTPVVGQTIDFATTAGADLAKGKTKKILEKNIAESLNMAIKKANTNATGLAGLLSGTGAGKTADALRVDVYPEGDPRNQGTQ